MKELNEMVELAKKASVAGQGTPEMVDFRVTANPDNILAIAKAFQALEQRAEAAEAKMVNQDYFGSLVSKARISADKAMVKFPQPNYVLLKVAEEAGEVVQAGVHYAENRMTWQELEGEIVQLMAMLIRLVTEGDQVNGITPPESCRDFSPAPAAYLAPGEWTNEQCLEFLSIAFRHAEISGDIEMDDIRLAVKMVNAGATYHQ